LGEHKPFIMVKHAASYIHKVRPRQRIIVESAFFARAPRPFPTLGA
jgi:hypothetical protein